MDAVIRPKLSLGESFARPFQIPKGDGKRAVETLDKTFQQDIGYLKGMNSSVRGRFLELPVGGLA